MKKTGNLNQPISAVIAGLGHTDLWSLPMPGYPFQMARNALI